MLLLTPKFDNFSNAGNQMSKKHLLLILFTTICLFNLSACKRTHHAAYEPPPLTAADLEYTQQSMLVFQHGDEIRIVLANDDLFFPGSSKLKAHRSKNKILNQLSATLHSYGNVPIVITGYTDNAMNPKNSRRIALERAQSIATYLWTKGYSLNNITTRSAGHKTTISSNETMTGSRDNRRVEIFFRRL